MTHPDHWTREERHVLHPFEDDAEPNIFETLREVVRLFERHAPLDQAELFEHLVVRLRSTGSVQ